MLLEILSSWFGECGYMKRILLTAAVLFAMGLVLLFTSNIYAMEGEEAPDFTLVDIDGNTFTLSSHSGKVVLVKFMTTDCPTCASQTDNLRTVREKYGEDDLEMVSISVSSLDNETSLRAYRDSHQADWIFALGTQSLAVAYGVQAVPHMFFIDGEGRIVSSFAGPALESWEVESRIEQAISATDVMGTTVLPILSALLMIVALGLVVYMAYSKREYLRRQLFGGSGS